MCEPVVGTGIRRSCARKTRTPHCGLRISTQRLASQLHHSFGLMRAKACVDLMEIRGIHWFWTLYPNLEAVLDKCTCQTGVRLKTHLMAYRMKCKDDICTSGIRRLCSCSCSRAPKAVPTSVQQCSLGNVTECLVMPCRTPSTYSGTLKAMTHAQLWPTSGVRSDSVLYPSTASLELRLISEARARHGHAWIGQDGIPTCRCVIANLVDVI